MSKDLSYTRGATRRIFWAAFFLVLASLAILAIWIAMVMVMAISESTNGRVNNSVHFSEMANVLFYNETHPDYDFGYVARTCKSLAVEDSAIADCLGFRQTQEPDLDKCSEPKVRAGECYELIYFGDAQFITEFARLIEKDGGPCGYLAERVSKARPDLKHTTSQVLEALGCTADRRAVKEIYIRAFLHENGANIETVRFSDLDLRKFTILLQ